MHPHRVEDILHKKINSMANWCHNRVLFTGEPGKVGVVHAFFEDLEEQLSLYKDYDVPAFVKGKHNGMFDIWLSDEYLHFKSAWQPTLHALCDIADHFGVGYIARYEEPAAFEYGQAYYLDGEMNGVRLTRADVNIGYDTDRKIFLFEGKEFDNDHTIIYSLFDKKIAEFEMAHPEKAEHHFKTREITGRDEQEPQRTGFKR